MDVAPGLPIMYTNVTEYLGTSANNIGKNVYAYGLPYSPSNYEINDHSYQWEEPHYYHPYHYDKGNFVPKLQQKDVFDNTNKKLYTEYNHYNTYFTNTYTTGIKFTHDILYKTFRPFQAISSNGVSSCCLCNASSTTCTMSSLCLQSAIEYRNSIAAIDTKAIQEATLLEYTVKTVYDRLNPNKSVTDSIHYVYNQHNLMPKEASTVNSLGENILTQYKYPYDFSSSQPYQAMLNKNILTPVIEQTIKSNTKQVQKTQTLYKNWGNNIIEPELVKGQMDVLTPLEDRIRFVSYDKKGNVNSLKKENGTPVTYLWGYGNTLPIAMVENCNLVSQPGTESQDKYISNSLYIPMGSTSYELGTFTITEEKNYKIDRTYERYPENYSVMYQISFENTSNSSGTVTFTDTTPASGNNHLFTSPSVLLKPGTYKVKLINIGYNGYQGSIENNFNFTIYNTVNINKAIPFHTSFEDDEEYINTSQAKTGIKSHVGQFNVKLPDASLGYDKVIVSYWGKSGDTSPWEYVENIVNVNGQNFNIGQGYFYIDEVRVYPVNAMMTTYTYDPFYKGQTSITSPNGQTEYFSYDQLGRLSEVFIIENNIKKLLKTTNYHYKP